MDRHRRNRSYHPRNTAHRFRTDRDSKDHLLDKKIKDLPDSAHRTLLCLLTSQHFARSTIRQGRKGMKLKMVKRQNSSDFLFVVSYRLQHITSLICCEKFIRKRHSTFIGGKKCRVHKIIFSDRCFFVLS